MSSRQMETSGNGGTGAPRAPGPPSSSRNPGPWRLRTRTLDASEPLIMGILNLTPDSFSDGGELDSLEKAMDRARAMAAQGVHILDVGGESTRPGAQAISPDEEARRVLPFLELASRELELPLSVDTRSAAVARWALEAGAEIVNDVSGLKHDPEMAATVAAFGAGVVVSHMRGTPATMTEEAEYGDVVEEVRAELGESLATARRAGVGLETIVLDPGIGFAKKGPQNLTLLARLGELGVLGQPILVGPSRKRFIGELTGAPEKERLAGTIAACVMAYLQGARIFRVHDVGPVIQALTVTRAVVEAAE